VLDDPRRYSSLTAMGQMRKQEIARGKLRYRPLLVLKFAIRKYWPELESSRSQPENLTSDIVTSPKQRNDEHTGGRPTVVTLVWNSLTEKNDHGDKLNRTDKEVAAEVAEMNRRKLGDKGWSERIIKQHISDWRKRELVLETLNRIELQGSPSHSSPEQLARIVAEKNGVQLGDSGWQKDKIEVYVGEWLEANRGPVVQK
jgi:hypothetical protein